MSISGAMPSLVSSSRGLLKRMLYFPLKTAMKVSFSPIGFGKMPFNCALLLLVVFIHDLDNIQGVLLHLKDKGFCFIP